MKVKKIWLVFLALSCSVNSSSVESLDAGADVAPWSVRVETFERTATNDPGQTRAIEIQVWYPNTQEDPPPPLILYSHGCGGTADEASHLQEHLADNGFVVAGINHPGVSRADCPRGCGNSDTRSCNFRGAVWERPDDVRFVRDTIVSQSRNPDSFWFGRIDPSKLGMSGHSDGGSTTEQVGSDPEFSALILMAPSNVFGSNITNVRIPTFVINGGPQELHRAETLFQSLEMTPRFIFYVTGSPSTGHWSFFDLEYTVIKPEYPREVFHEYLRRFSTAFWNTYLRGVDELSVLNAEKNEDRIVLLADP